ncbi:MAG TPA: hypothetical protein VHU80_22665 [Polyangiaceae bacterium]|nr:hypothetical protein [Polyangiaceae bacterium]
MSKDDKDEPELVRAARALESQVVELETLSRSVRKIRLNSEKSIARAAKELGEVLSMPERMAARLTTVAEAMQQMQTRQQAALEPLALHAAEIQKRMQQLGEHMQTFSELGKAAGEVTALLQTDSGDRAGSLKDARERLTQIAEGAAALHDAARSADFPEVVREADALKQRIVAARRRIDGTS